MKLIYTGKTKDVFELDDGNYLLKLKDDATGKDGIFDPGENSVGLSIEGLGRESLRMTKYYFEKLNAACIPTHFISADIDAVSMKVRPAEGLCKKLEVVCRFRAVGSFFKRYSEYIEEGAELDGVVEFTLKNDKLADPPINKDSIEALKILTGDEFERCREMALSIARLVKADLCEKGLELYDIKFEFGKSNGEIILIDEISGGTMRVYKNGTWMQPMDLAEYFKGGK